jgi:hypothetical protein
MATAATATFVNQAAQRLGQLGDAVNPIEDDQAIFVRPQEDRRVAELLVVLPRFKVEVKRSRLRRHRKRECCPADLPRDEQAHGSLPVQGVRDQMKGRARYRPCTLNIAD